MPLHLRKYATNRKTTQLNLAIQLFKLIFAIILLGITVILAATLFIYLLIGTLIVLGYFWWKTRTLRREIKMRTRQAFNDENTIEGEIIEHSNAAPK